MTTETQQKQPFNIKDCALIAIATGKRAQNLSELRSLVERISRDSIYYHFWGGQLRAGFDAPEYHNDLATWAHHGLHDKILAERLSLISPMDYATIDDLRSELVEIIDERLDEIEFPSWSERDRRFEFIRSQIVVFDTHRTLNDPGELADALPKLSLSSIFYHFIDARRRNEESIDDFHSWIRAWDGEHEELRRKLAQVDPYFSTLSELRGELARIAETVRR